MRQITVMGARTLPEAEAAAVRLEVSRAIMARPRPTIVRPDDAPERASVARAMFAVEAEIVAAFDILDRSTSIPGPRSTRKHGIDYPMEKSDKWGAAVGQGWLSEQPAPPPPTAAEIDGFEAPLDWLQMLDPLHRTILSAGARSKRGDVNQRVNWFLVKQRYPELERLTSDRLKRMYNHGLRVIAAEVGRA